MPNPVSPQPEIGPGLTLILGGAHAGKSRYARRLAGAAGVRIVPERGAVPQDWGSGWTHVEEPVAVAAAVLQAGRLAATGAVVVDDVADLIANLIVADGETPDPHRVMVQMVAQLEELADAAGAVGLPVVLVTSEVGHSLPPTTPMGQLFLRCVGLANQRLAAAASEVHYVMAGLMQRLK